MARLSISLVFIGLIVVPHVMGHIALLSPEPRNPSTGIKSGPCGGDAFWGNGQPTTTVAPGTLTVQWEETINHEGTPFFFALSCGDDTQYKDWILTSHLKHNDIGLKDYQFDIEIPDINCPQASLALINPMTDKIQADTCCCYGDFGAAAPLEPQCFSVYHTCANIEITGQGDPSAALAAHVNPPMSYIYSKGESCTWNDISGGQGTLYEPSAECTQFDAVAFQNTCAGFCGLPEAGELGSSAATSTSVATILVAVVAACLAVFVL